MKITFNKRYHKALWNISKGYFGEVSEVTKKILQENDLIKGNLITEKGVQILNDLKSTPIDLSTKEDTVWFIRTIAKPGLFGSPYMDSIEYHGYVKWNSNVYRTDVLVAYDKNSHDYVLTDKGKQFIIDNNNLHIPDQWGSFLLWYEVFSLLPVEQLSPYLDSTEELIATEARKRYKEVTCIPYKAEHTFE